MAIWTSTTPCSWWRPAFHPTACAYKSKVTFESEAASFRNTFGYFREDTGEAEIVFADIDETTLGGRAPRRPLILTAEQYDQLAFFLIPDGATTERRSVHPTWTPST